MDEALDEGNTTQASKKVQEDWQMNLETMKSQCPICNKKKRNSHFPTNVTPSPKHVEVNRDPIQRHRPQGHSWTGPDQAFGHMVEHVA